MNRTTFCMLSLVAILTACSSNPIHDYAEIQEKQARQQEKTAKEQFKDVPDWFVNPPANNNQGVYAVGTVSSSDLQFSLESAQLNAEFALAKALNQEIAGIERAYRRSDGNGNITSNGETIITKFVDARDIVGYTVVQREIQRHNGQNITYVLLHLPYTAQQKILAKRQRATNAASAQKAYEEVAQQLRERQASQAVKP